MKRTNGRRNNNRKRNQAALKKRDEALLENARKIFKETMEREGIADQDLFTAVPDRVSPGGPDPHHH
ncbi:hypothetical protein V2J09_018943 [Rumex salicifolius]